MNARLASLLQAFAMAVLLLGCGEPQGPPRVAISGTVTVDGILLVSGIISLVPEGDGPATGAEITDGKFSIAKERGPTIGKYAVRVTTQPQKSLSADDEPQPAKLLRTSATITADTMELKLDFE